MSEFFGKYRGQVTNNTDPELRGRIQVMVPAVLGQGRMAWALPATPYAGSGVGLFAVPPIGANVWVEFEAGDPNSPIWTGCFWGRDDVVPAQPALPTVKVLQTDHIMLKLDDTPGAGGFTLEVNAPVAPGTITVSCTTSGVEISVGAAKIALTPASVSINDGALEVI